MTPFIGIILRILVHIIVQAALAVTTGVPVIGLTSDSKNHPKSSRQELPSRNPLEHNNKGVELGAKGHWSDAIREHEIALDADPENAVFRQNLSSANLHYADLLASHKKYDEAIDHYRKALYADPANVPADSQLDSCLRAIGENPAEYSVRAGFADVAYVTDNNPVAVVEYRKCIKMSDSGPDRYRLARVFYKQGKLVEAYEELRIAITKKWKKAEINEQSNCYCLMGDILMEVIAKAKIERRTIFLKRLDNAYSCYGRALALNPRNQEALKGWQICKYLNAVPIDKIR